MLLIDESSRLEPTLAHESFAPLKAFDIVAGATQIDPLFLVRLHPDLTRHTLQTVFVSSGFHALIRVWDALPKEQRAGILVELLRGQRSDRIREIKAYCDPKYSEPQFVLVNADDEEFSYRGELSEEVQLISVAVFG
ncbi:hypothetical protein Cmtc_17660 [Cupriavidus sp. TKC]|nr:hypothetical protein Cmtc_17660 [Cupriavidus sp. TKC]HBD33982.1 hypothetical protein [Cupriavidus sp.]HBO80021.1 hypothetical protein [Cupriavidus sp.]